jgi:hypothetical protein
MMPNRTGRGSSGAAAADDMATALERKVFDALGEFSRVWLRRERDE